MKVGEVKRHRSETQEPGNELVPYPRGKGKQLCGLQTQDFKRRNFLWLLNLNLLL